MREVVLDLILSEAEFTENLAAILAATGRDMP